MRFRPCLAFAVLVLGTTSGIRAGSMKAYAHITDSKGEEIGTAKLEQTTSGVKISLKASHLPPGVHGLHIHAAGKCEAPDFKTAGGHFNPENKKHGMKNPAGPHAGDLPNLDVGANGKASFSAVDSRVTLGDGPNSLFQPGGTSLVIHAQPDDEMTDPSGNSGARIACGVIEKK